MLLLEGDEAVCPNFTRLLSLRAVASQGVLDGIGSRVQRLRAGGPEAAGGVVLLEGDEGAGKSRVLEEVRRAASGAMLSGQIFWSRGDAVHSSQVRSTRAVAEKSAHSNAWNDLCCQVGPTDFAAKSK